MADVHHDDDRGYDAACAFLSTLINQRKRGDGSNSGDAFSLMTQYVKILQLEEDIEKMNIVHVAGTKGKGSTCAFAESIFRAHGLSSGLFTSPHLVDVRERFRFNGKEVDMDLFLSQFWWCADRLKGHVTEEVPMPAYFRFLTLLAFKLFSTRKVDVVILEVGLGGRYDATNIVKKPVVCGVSSLGYDHMEILGHTLKLISAEKAAIFKAGVPAVTSPQVEEAMDSLRAKSTELNIPLIVAPPVHQKLLGTSLGLAGEHQRLNASLAVELCRTWMDRMGQHKVVEEFNQCDLQGKLPDKFLEGLRTAHWPGRAQVLLDEEGSFQEGAGRLAYFLDGAHSPESMEVCGKWFADVAGGQSKSDVMRVLLFNCMPERDPRLLFPPLLSVLKQNGITLDHAVFVPGHSSYTSIGPFKSPAGQSQPKPNLTWQKEVQKVWESLNQPQAVSACRRFPDPTSASLQYGSHGRIVPGNEPNVGPKELATCHWANQSVVFPSLPLALDFFRRSVRCNPPLRLQVLVTGSLHLVGDVIRLAKK